MTTLPSDILHNNEASNSSITWGHLLVAVAFTLLFASVMYWDTVERIGKIWWRSDTYAHGMLIFPISMYLIYGRRETLSLLTPNINIFGLLVIAILSAAWLFAYAANVLFVQQLMIVAMIVAIALTLLGAEVLKAIAFPAAYLFFMVPIGESLTPIMQDFTAVYTVKLLQLTGIPVFLEGRYFSIPTGKFEVAEACSGVRYLIASVALGCLYAYITYSNYKKRSVFIVFCILVPIIANVLRAYGIVMLAYLSDMRLATGVDHVIYGWVFFGLVMFILFWVGSYWRDPDNKTSESDERNNAARFKQYKKSKLAIILVVTNLIIISGPVMAMWIESNSELERVVKINAPTVEKSSYINVDEDKDSWHPSFQGATNEGRWVYTTGDGTKIHLYIAHYENENENSELISTQNSVFDGKQWLRVSSNREMVSPTSTGELGTIETRIRQGREKRLVWHWYFISDLQTEDGMTAKFSQAMSKISGNKKGSAVVAIAANYLTNEQEARLRMLQFMGAFHPVWNADQFWNNIIICDKNCG